MCGIAAISMSHADNVMDASKVAKSLLQGIASRGPDATGAAWYKHEDDTVQLTKVAVPAWRFIEAREEVFPKETPAMVMHTRYATHGNVEDRRNNHPVNHGNIIGVHNGVLQNHKELFEKMGTKPNGEVDSEALMMLLNDEVKGKAIHPTKAFSNMKGDAAIAWIDLRNPEVLHLANVVGRPMHILQTKQGSVIMASTEKAVKDAAKDNGLEISLYKEVPEETYLRISYGVIEEWLTIENVHRPSSDFSKKYAWTSGTGNVPKKATPVAPKPNAVKTVGEAVKEAVENLDYKKLTDEKLLEMEKLGNKQATHELNDRVYAQFLATVSLERLRKMVSSDTTNLESKVLIGLELSKRAKEKKAADKKLQAEQDAKPMALAVSPDGVVDKAKVAV